MKNLLTAILMTVVTTLLLGLIYPLLVTGLAQLLFPAQANGQLVLRNGEVVGSRLLGQPFTSPHYFHSRPSAAGAGGYDATASGGSNLAPTNKSLVERVKADVAKLQAENPGKPIPIDLVTTSASGLDPHISPATAAFQIPRVARAWGMTETSLRMLVDQYTEGRTLGLWGEARVNVLMLNLALDEQQPIK
jgi:K+-transporting ATPase ATPase C chain